MDGEQRISMHGAGPSDGGLLLDRFLSVSSILNS